MTETVQSDVADSVGSADPAHSTGPAALDALDALPTWESTGHSRVDQAVAGLTELAVLPTPQHAEVYEDVHRRLHEALADLDGA